jgi:hypothetical protein
LTRPVSMSLALMSLVLMSLVLMSLVLMSMIDMVGSYAFAGSDREELWTACRTAHRAKNNAVKSTFVASRRTQKYPPQISPNPSALTNLPFRDSPKPRIPASAFTKRST